MYWSPYRIRSHQPLLPTKRASLMIIVNGRVFIRGFLSYSSKKLLWNETVQIIVQDKFSKLFTIFKTPAVSKKFQESFSRLIISHSKNTPVLHLIKFLVRTEKILTHLLIKEFSRLLCRTLLKKVNSIPFM